MNNIPFKRIIDPSDGEQQNMGSQTICLMQYLPSKSAGIPSLSAGERIGRSADNPGGFNDIVV
jgi:hypothetical protein